MPAITANTVTNSQASTPGGWLEILTTAAMTVTANAETAFTITIPAGTPLLSTLPIFACCLQAGSVAINGGVNNWGTGIGLRTATLSGSTLTLTLAADAAAAATVPLGARIIVFNCNGV
jgi:hypothetical protein